MGDVKTKMNKLVISGAVLTTSQVFANPVWKYFDGCIILITIGCYDEIERQERYTILRKLIGLNRDWHIRSGFSADKFVKTILEENIIA